MTIGSYLTVSLFGGLASNLMMNMMHQIPVLRSFF